MRRRLLLSCAILLSLCACNQNTPNAETEVSVILNPPGTLPVVDEPVRLTGFIPSIGLIEDINQNAAMKAVEERTNIHIDWIEASKVDARNTLRLMLAGDDYPGIIQGTYGSGLSSQDLEYYGMQGTFLPLNELIEEHGVNIKAMFEAYPFVLDAITSSDGNIYGLPAVFTDDYHMTMRQKLWINQQWLENLGLATPQTLDELYDVLIAFRDRDANGNGIANDEIPLSGANRSLEDVAMWIMNAFIPAGGPDDSGDTQLNNYEFIIDDQVVFSADKEAFREGLRFLRRLYLENLLDVRALTQRREQIRSLVQDGREPRVGAVASHHPGNFTDINDDPDALFRQYVALAPVTGPQGLAFTPWMIDAVIETGQFIITDHTENPELAIRLADYFYSMEFAEIDKGIEGYHWRRIDGSNMLAINSGEAKYLYLRTLRPEDNAQINMGPIWTRDLKNEFARTSEFSYEQMLYDATRLYEPFKLRRFPYATISMPESYTDEFDYLRRIIHRFVGESVDRFIIGDLDIDSQWDEYVRQLGSIGLPRYMDILNTAYNNEE